MKICRYRKNEMCLVGLLNATTGIYVRRGLGGVIKFSNKAGNRYTGLYFIPAHPLLLFPSLYVSMSVDIGDSASVESKQLIFLNVDTDSTDFDVWGPREDVI